MSLWLHLYQFSFLGGVYIWIQIAYRGNMSEKKMGGGESKRASGEFPVSEVICAAPDTDGGAAMPPGRVKRTNLSDAKTRINCCQVEQCRRANTEPTYMEVTHQERQVFGFLSIVVHSLLHSSALFSLFFPDVIISEASTEHLVTCGESVQSDFTAAAVVMWVSFFYPPKKKMSNKNCFYSSFISLLSRNMKESFSDNKKTSNIHSSCSITGMEVEVCRLMRKDVHCHIFSHTTPDKML